MFPRIRQFVDRMSGGGLTMREEGQYLKERAKGQQNAMFARDQHMREIHERVNGLSTRPTGPGAPTREYRPYQPEENTWGVDHPILRRPLPPKPPRM
jgi:hypothetical protein